jgi:hypothetical protein
MLQLHHFESLKLARAFQSPSGDKIMLLLRAMVTEYYWQYKSTPCQYYCTKPCDLTDKLLPAKGYSTVLWEASKGAQLDESHCIWRRKSTIKIKLLCKNYTVYH